jgi:ABC-type amino acid transport substrate-binding protein
MSSIPRYVLLLLLLAVPLSGSDFPEIQRRGSLRALVVLDTRRPEFFALPPARPGFDRELIAGFAQRHQLKLEVVTLPGWDDLIPALLANKGDVIVGGFRDTEARRRSVAFSVETFPTRIVVVTLKPHRVVKTAAELRTERVGVMKGTAMADAAVAAGVPPRNLDDGIAVGSYAEALHAGRITAGIWSIDRAIPAQREDPDLQLGMFLERPGTLAFAVRKDDPQLLAAINDQISNVRRSGAWSQLVVKYFGENALALLKVAGGQTSGR